jgi:Mor family transcriptional regulator
MPKIRSAIIIKIKTDLEEEVRKTYKKGGVSIRELSEKYNRSPAWVFKVIHRKGFTK